MEYQIREIRESEYEILADFLYEGFMFLRERISLLNPLLVNRSFRYILRILEKQMTGAWLRK